MMELVANWKQFLNPEEEVRLLHNLITSSLFKDSYRLIILPSFLSLRECVNQVNTSKSTIVIGAQDISSSLIEAQTGNIRADHIPANTVLIGHSEREKNSHESVSDQLKKLEVAISLNKNIVLCFGEKDKCADDTELLAVLKMQLGQYRSSLTDIALQNITLAYEPQWSIGNTKTASSTIVKKVLALAQTFGFEKMLYGGSVDAATIEQVYFSGLDGFLIGRASTKLESLKEIFAKLKQLT